MAGNLGDIGQASQDMIKELQKMQHQDQTQKSDHGAKFGEVLNSTQTETQAVGTPHEMAKTTPAMQAIKAAQINDQLKIEQTRVAQAQKPSMLNNAIKELMGGQNKLEDLMKVAMSGQKLNNQEMIGIQAGVYMYSQQMELTSKVIDKATSGIKQAMNTQV